MKFVHDFTLKRFSDLLIMFREKMDQVHNYCYIINNYSKIYLCISHILLSKKKDLK